MNLREHQDYRASRAEIARAMSQYAPSSLIAKVAPSLAAAISRHQATDQPTAQS